MDNNEIKLGKLKAGYEKAKKVGKKKKRGWLRDNCEEIAELIKNGIPIADMITVLGGSIDRLVRALNDARCPELALEIVQSMKNKEMEEHMEDTEAIMEDLRRGRAEANIGGSKGRTAWAEDKNNGGKIAKLLEAGVPFNKIVKNLGSREPLIRAVRDAGFGHLLTEKALGLLKRTKKVKQVPENIKNEEKALTAELKAGKTAAQKGGYGAVRKWTKENAQKIRKLVEMSKKSIGKLSKLTGITKPTLRKYGRGTSITPRVPAPAQPQQEKKRPTSAEILQTTFSTYKPSEVADMILTSFLDRIKVLTKERDAAEKEVEECRKLLVKANEDLKRSVSVAGQRDKKLSESVQSALVVHSEGSLNGQNRYRA